MYDELKEAVAHLVRLQRDLCNKFATEGRKILDHLGFLTESAEPREKKKLSKAEENDLKEAYKKLWLVGKGTPQNKILKRLKEYPDVRAETKYRDWETAIVIVTGKQQLLS